MLGLNDCDREFAEVLRREGVLQDVDGHRLDLAEGVILVACADGDQMPDLFRHQASLQTEHRGVPRPHLLALNGGGLRIPRGSSLNGGAGEVLLKDIGDARLLKGISMVALYVHAPCGAARLAGFTLEQEITLLMDAKVRVKEECGEVVRVACFVHLDWGDGRRRTYFISRANWMARLARSKAASDPTRIGTTPA